MQAARRVGRRGIGFPVGADSAVGLNALEGIEGVAGAMGWPSMGFMSVRTSRTAPGRSSFHADLAQDAGLRAAAALARGQIGLPAVGVEGVAQQGGAVLLGSLVAGVNQRGGMGIIGAEKLPTGTLTTTSASFTLGYVVLDAGIEGAIENAEERNWYRSGERDVSR